MKKIMMLLCAVCLLIGCTSSQKAVKYQVAKNYFFVIKDNNRTGTR